MERKKHVGRNLPAEADEQNADPSCLIFPFKKSCLIENLKIAMSDKGHMKQGSL